MPTPTTSSNVISVNWSGDIRIDALMFGQRWTNSTISYSFPNQYSFWSTDPFTGYGPENGDEEPWSSAFSPLTPSDQEAFNLALQRWSNVATIQFNPVTESQFTVGDLRAAYTFTTEMTGAEAWTYLPTGIPAGGDIWFNKESNSARVKWSEGNYSFLTAMHEIGHALGLTHPFDNRQFPASLDTMSSTIMSYSAIAGDKSSGLTFYPTTPMLLDILAIQHMYGANELYHREDNVYQFDDTRTYHETIWDGGGIDWIQYHGTQAARIDLREAEGSSIGNTVMALDSNSEHAIPNVWIAYGTVIEHAQGGQSDDLLIGNDHDNILVGGNGRDTLVGLGGRDTFHGEAGVDTVLYLGERARYAVSQSEGGYTVVDQAGSDGQDNATGIERLQFNDMGLALDLDGYAGQVAKLLGAVFGAAEVDNKAYVGTGLWLFDGGMNHEAVATVALDAVGVSTHDEVVTLLWRNLFGSNPTQAEKQPYLQVLESGEVSAAALAIYAADSAINTGNIDLVGLMQTGVEYTL
ncbi:Peptidase M10A and M12B matrixin and adamalysin [Nitrosomonas nitrosa]|uniref:Matrixin n=1 Tax=Nitrosomonas nitrosa TaxID=52442 RepID=A0A1I4UCM1_9PROT|nr:M10 family metallopeptidase [Nitrosomonas nitrosa]CAE6494050.1 Peptidase M10A and M12B matrixin and adamalysin [Nitrosomonas nitrosa]SFM86591.1 Matrixin [Nitrosomonas nitrosa]